MNKVILTGRLTTTPTIKASKSGKMFSQFTIAVNRITKDAAGQREVDFVLVVVWGKIAEYCTNYLVKGQNIGLAGRLQIRSYETKDGGKRYIAEVIAEQVESLEPPKEHKTSTATPMDGFGTEVSDDEIPF